MKLGLMTAAFPNWSLEKLAAWATENGFEMLELACWPVGKAERRYAGVTHIDVADFDAQKAKDVKAIFKKYRLGNFFTGVLSQPSSPRSGPPRDGHRPSEKGDRRRRDARCAGGGHLRRP